MTRRDVAIRWTADGECERCKGGGLLPVHVNSDGSRSSLRKVCGCVRAEPGHAYSDQPSYKDDPTVRAAPAPKREGADEAPRRMCAACDGRGRPYSMPSAICGECRGTGTTEAHGTGEGT
jgi:DnaJ-class molecular chaperone